MHGEVQMKDVLATLCALVILAAVTRAGPDDFPEDLGKWIAVEPPEKNSDDWLAANHSSHEWTVILRDGRPRVLRRDPSLQRPGALPFEIAPGMADEGLAGRRYTSRVNDGWIVAFNAGEFGAGLWWFSPDGKTRRKIAEAWIGGFVRTDSGLLAIEGLAHKGESRGRILRLVRDPQGRWNAEDIVEPEECAQVAVKAADGSLLVATTAELLRVDPSTKKAKVLVQDAFWGGLYPSSMVVGQDGTIYLGMRQGVAQDPERRREVPGGLAAAE